MAGKQLIDSFGRLSWDSYYLAIAHVVQMRSIDPSTKHGAVIVSKTNRVLSLGYNGPLRGVIDSEIPLTRPGKYYHLLHAEENCLLSYGGSNQDIEGATCYVTGRPCYKCLRMLMQKGIVRIVCGNISSFVVDDDDLNAQKIMLKNSRVQIDQYESSEVLISLQNVSDYILKKGEAGIQESSNVKKNKMLTRALLWAKRAIDKKLKS